MSLFRRETLIERLARETHWLVTKREGDCYRLRGSGTETMHYIHVRNQPSVAWVKFTAGFPIRFSLEHTPSGLFGRLLLRSVSLHYSHWLMDIRESCEAQCYLCGQWPVSVMTPKFFNAVCREMTNELADFHQELRDKFHYGGGRTYARPGDQASVPQRWTSGTGQDIVWLGE